MPEEKDTNVNKKNGGAEACYNIAKVEHSHVFNRSDKLDKAVSILLRKKLTTLLVKYLIID